MSECNKCGITDFEITPEQIKNYLGEEPDKDILQNQTDKMFFFINEEVICRICNLKNINNNQELKDEDEAA
tara:strand:- start:571 stop:783 length:213 start_codon:yes stop_codon:yes gene_type:complete